jgi:DNA-directed RNA polymerase specialized sigma24 family protein
MDQRELIRSGEWARRVAALPPKQREVFEWYRSGRSILELARATNRSRSTLTNYLNRARQKMQAPLPVSG